MLLWSFSVVFDSVFNTNTVAVKHIAAYKPIVVDSLHLFKLNFVQYTLLSFVYIPRICKDVFRLILGSRISFFYHRHI